MDLGADDMDANGHLARFEAKVRELRVQNISFEMVASDIQSAIQEIPLEGRRLGSRAPVLREIEITLTSLAEEIMTEPAANQLSLGPSAGPR